MPSAARLAGASSRAGLRGCVFAGLAGMLTCDRHCFSGQDVLGAVVEAYAWRQAALWIVGPSDSGSWISPCRMLSHAGFAIM